MIQCIYKVKETKGKVKVLKMKTRILDKIEFNYELAKNPKSNFIEPHTKHNKSSGNIGSITVKA